MNSLRLLPLAAFALLLASPRTIHAAGFEIGEESAAATAMAGAFTAKADDASAVFYNPAGMTKTRGLQLYVGGMLVLGRTTAGDSSVAMLASDQRSDTAAVFIPNLYLTYDFAHDIAIGAGVFTNFGLQSIWPDSFAGRFVSQYAALQDVTINFSVAWRPVSWFSIGGGIDVTPARVDLRRAENVVDTEVGLRFRGNAVGVGANVGVLFEIPRQDKMPPLSIGVSYRSRYDLNFNDGGLRTFNAPLELSGVLHDSVASASLPIPDVVSAGIGVRPIEALFLQVQFDWTNWAQLQTVQLTAANNPQLNLAIDESWKSGYTLRAGGEWTFATWTARLGVGYDWSPVPERTLGPVFPDADRFLVSGGVGIPLVSNLAVEGAAMAVIFRDRTSTLPEFPVQYATWALLLSAGLSYHFPAPAQASRLSPPVPPADSPTIAPAPVH